MEDFATVPTPPPDPAGRPPGEAPAGGDFGVVSDSFSAYPIEYLGKRWKRVGAFWDHWYLEGVDGERAVLDSLYDDWREIPPSVVPGGGAGVSVAQIES